MIFCTTQERAQRDGLSDVGQNDFGRAPPLGIARISTEQSCGVETNVPRSCLRFMLRPENTLLGQPIAEGRRALTIWCDQSSPYRVSVFEKQNSKGP